MIGYSAITNKTDSGNAPGVQFGNSADLTWELANACAQRDMLLKAMRDIRDCMAFPEQVEGDLRFRVLSVATAAISDSRHFIRV